MEKKSGAKIGLSEVFPWPVVLLSAGLIALVTFIRLDFTNEFNQLYVLSSWLTLLGGSQTVVDPPPFELLQWLMLVTPLIYFVGVYMEQETRKRLPFVLCRSFSYGRWWFRIMKAILLGCLVHTLICLIIPTLAVLVFGGGLYRPGGELLKEAMTPLVFFLYIAMAAILQALLYLLWEDKRISFVVAAIFPVLSYILCSVSPQAAIWFPGSWGMAWRYLSLVDMEGSGLVGNQYYIILPIELLVCGGIYYWGKSAIGKKGITDSAD